jgi:hypothetical protein
MKPLGVNEYPGEPGGIRTRDPVLKRHMLYLLSYRPWLVAKRWKNATGSV